VVIFVSKSTVSFRHISIFMRVTLRSVINNLNSVQTLLSTLSHDRKVVGGGLTLPWK